jgi:hypothetical protein
MYSKLGYKTDSVGLDQMVGIAISSLRLQNIALQNADIEFKVFIRPFC